MESSSCRLSFGSAGHLAKQKVGMLMCWSLRCMRLLKLLEGCREKGNGLMLVERGCEKIRQGASLLFMKLLLAMGKLRVSQCSVMGDLWP